MDCRFRTIQTIKSLNPATTYELQVKVNPIYDCDEEGWSTEIYYFTTKIGDYSYNVVNTCFPNNDGQIDFEIEPENSYVFNWISPDGFTQIILQLTICRCILFVTNFK